MMIQGGRFRDLALLGMWERLFFEMESFRDRGQPIWHMRHYYCPFEMDGHDNE
jgi:hypothetical protein